MVKSFEDFNLEAFNTFGIKAKASELVQLYSEEEIEEVASSVSGKDFLVLGKGSNILFKGPRYNGLVILLKNEEVKVIHENEDNITLEVGAGKEWDDFVDYCVTHGYGGIENLSHIPGNVGACPIQNIGAYGVEVKDVIESVRFYNIEKKTWSVLENDACAFGYRSSVFKVNLRHKVIIASVCFKLTKRNHVYRLDYGNLKNDVLAIGAIGLKNIRQAIINIRESKLPDPDKMGNAGSFFKNPLINRALFNELAKAYPTMPNYDAENDLVKIPAAWLIDQCGWKGKVVGNVAVHNKQALVLVNKTGDAKGSEILQLGNTIRESVFEKFGIQLEFEVNVV